MLRKSLYVRIVATFIGVVIISISTSYFITAFFFLEREVVNITSRVAEIIELADPEKLPEMAETLESYHFDIMIMDEEGVPLLEQHTPFVISDEDIASVFQSDGQVPMTLSHRRGDVTKGAGFQVEIMNEPYALFVYINSEEEMKGIRGIINISLILVLLVGSLLIFLASRHLVNPIKMLTHAAKEMAKGNFSVRIKSKNKDEIGELITSFNHMATEVEKIDQMRDDFVSSVSHEIQSPLTSIRGFTKAIRDEVIPTQNQKEYLDIIYHETDRLSRLSENLLRLASLDSEHHPYRPERYRLDEQIRRTVLATEPQWKIRELQIHLELEPIEVMADQDLLEQVWLNLITNAIKYSSQKGAIHIELKRGDKGVSVSVKDYGKGITKEAIPYLFDRFYKVDKARGSSIDGNGLGLSIVKKILGIHNYSIDVLSEEGVGSTFVVTIPNKDGTEAVD
ncbi:sensor histidine kinase [Halalkalibacter flavus]|uniref:sensor histidine kinase n=1 Tax=Halalkalibacter flavus TaxID=3090668 RepID=UPI002FCB275F